LAKSDRNETAALILR